MQYGKVRNPQNGDWSRDAGPRAALSRSLVERRWRGRTITPPRASLESSTTRLPLARRAQRTIVNPPTISRPRSRHKGGRLQRHVPRAAHDEQAHLAGTAAPAAAPHTMPKRLPTVAGSGCPHRVCYAHEPCLLWGTG